MTRDDYLPFQPFRNDSGQTIPPYACMYVADAVVDGEVVALVQQPGYEDSLSDPTATFCFSTEVQTLAGDYNSCLYETPLIARVDPAANNLDSLAPLNGQWELGDNSSFAGPTYRRLGVLRQQNNGIQICLVQKNATGGSFGAAFFLTPVGGMAAAPSQFQPEFTLCERLYYNSTNGTIESATPPEFEQVGNHIEADIREDVVIQAKKIDTAWFVDVEPCE
jgi:hypothetical protein